MVTLQYLVLLGVTGQTTVQNLTTTGTTTIGPNTYPSIKGDAGKFLKTMELVF